MQHTPDILNTAKIEYGGKQQPYSAHYGDHYFSQQDGLAETRYVFLEGNQLPTRWQNKARFTIAETGFGTSLNFLATWQAWHNDPQGCTQLHYISIEKHPCPASVLKLIAEHWPSLKPFATALQQKWPPPLAGFHRLHFAHSQVILTLVYMDIADALEALHATVDAWFLDGFAPAKNQRMWNKTQLQHIAALTHPQGTLASFTAASQVRKDLTQCGFSVSKRTGFGKKREMITARLQQVQPKPNLPWFSLTTLATPKTQEATIIGGGLAGCQMAWHLAQRGWQITLVERHQHLATEASGNKAGVLAPKMTAEPSPGEDFYRQSFLYALQQLQQLDDAGFVINKAQCGLLQLTHNERETKRWHSLQARNFPTRFLRCLDTSQASALAGIPLRQKATYFPQAAWLEPASLCRALCQHPQIELIKQTEALNLHYDAALERWIIRDTSGKIVQISGTIVIANGKDVATLLPSAQLPLIPVRGQSSTAQANIFSQKLCTILGHEGFFIPAIDGQHWFGASFHRGNRSSRLQTVDNHENFSSLQRHLPQLAEQFAVVSSGHAALRMTTPDRYPICGSGFDTKQFYRQFRDISKGKKPTTYEPIQYQKGLYIYSGLGSRGITTSALCAEFLTAIICQEPLPISSALSHALHPARFTTRQLLRKNDH